MTYSKFQKLTPTDNVDLTGYREAFEFIFTNNDIRNVAISGAYSSGKSSLLETYKKFNKEKKFVHISLAHFEDTNKKQNNDGNTDTETIIEGKILNQLIQQIPEEKIPQTDFRIKKSVKDKRILQYTLLVLVFVLLSMFITKFEEWATFVGNMEESAIKSFLQGTTEDHVVIIAGVVLLIIFGSCIYRFLTIQKSKNILRKLSFQGNEIEIFSENENSYFDKYLNEVLYLFENADIDVFVFEDIDRFDNVTIFERLREINTLVNIRLDGKKTVRFFYLLRDELFSNKDRTKFFDYILPVVPVVDSSNSYNKLKEYLLYADMYQKFDDRFLRDLSLYIDDLRLLKNIINEFLIYYEKLKKIDLNENKMLAIIAYKNIFPQDFSDLQLNRGFVHALFEQKELFISDEKEKLQAQIKEYKHQIENCQNELLENKEELEWVKQAKFNEYNKLSISPRRRELEEAYKIWCDNVYPVRIIAIENKNNDNYNLIRNKLSQLQEQYKYLENAPLAQIINRDNIDEIFRISTKNEIGKDNRYESIKENEYFSLLKFLIRNGYLDESYNDYMTFFYENGLTRKDKLFLRSIADRKAKEYDYKLDNPGLVLTYLRETDFWQEECLNYSLLSYVIKKTVNEKYFEAFISQIKKSNNVGFVASLYSYEKDRERLVELINKHFPEFFSKILYTYVFSDEMLQEYSFYSLICSEINVLNGMNKGDMFKAYIEGQSSYYSFQHKNMNTLLESIKGLGIRFDEISINENMVFYNTIYEENLYKLNYKNICTFITTMYNFVPEEIDWTKCLTLIFSEETQPLYKYVVENLDEAVYAVLEGTEGLISDSGDCILCILNSELVSEENKLQYLKRLSTKIEKIEDIQDNQYRVEAIKEEKAICSVENIMNCYNIEKLSDTLIKFINESVEKLNFNNYEFLSTTVKNTFFKEVVAAGNLKDEKYQQILSTLKLSYSNFNIKGLEESKIQILIDEGIVQMTTSDLNFIRKEYPGCMQNYVEKNIEKYCSVVGANPPLEEIKCVLIWNVSIENKRIILGKTKEKISVFEKEYSEDIRSIIVKTHLHPDDIKGLLKEYSKFGVQLKESVRELAADQFNKVLEFSSEISVELILELLANSKIAMISRRNLLSKVISRINDEERVQALKSLNAVEIAKYFETNEESGIDLNEENKAILDILKESGIIAEYSEDSETKVLKISNRKEQNTELNVTLL